MEGPRRREAEDWYRRQGGSETEEEARDGQVN